MRVSVKGVAMKTKPKLETQADVDIKDTVKDFLQEHQYCKIYDTYEKMYYVDWFIANRDETRHWFAEFKRRNIDHDQYDEGVMLSLHKYLRLKEYSIISGQRSQLVVLFNDGLYHHPIYDGPESVPLGFNGRSDRGHEGDVEPVVYIRPSMFFRINGWEEWSEQSK